MIIAHDIVPVEGHAPHTHGIRIADGEYEGLTFAFGKIEFVGEDPEGNGILDFQYEIIVPPASGIQVEVATLDPLIAEILHKILKESSGIAEAEADERREASALAEAETQARNQSPLVLEDGSTVEVTEISAE